MQARAAVRRAGRRAVSKLNTESESPYVMDPIVDDVPVTPAQRVMRRTVAVLTSLILVAGGGGLLYLTAVSGGKGYQVAPVLALMVLVMFGLPALAVLYRHLQGVWYDTQ